MVTHFIVVSGFIEDSLLGLESGIVLQMKICVQDVDFPLVAYVSTLHGWTDGELC